VPRIRCKKILVVGDLIADAHHFAKHGGISTETGSVLGIHEKTELTWGGAGLLVRNLFALQAQVTFVSLLGNDEYASKIDEFTHKNLHKVFFKEPSRHTIVKERFLIDEKKVLRMNRGDSSPISKKTAAAVLQFVKKNIKSFDLILIADYRHGLMTEALAKNLIEEVHRVKKPIYIDSQVVRDVSNHNWYVGADVFCLNQKEAKSVDITFDEKDLEKSLGHLQKILNAENIIVKLGEAGSASLLGKIFMETPAAKVAARDPVGAGDAFFAALAVSSPPSKKALVFANRWAGLSTTILGTEPPTLSDLKKLKPQK